MSNNVGIWIDQREAFVVHAENREILHHIASEVEDYNLGGGYGGSVKYFQQDASSQTKLTNRKKQQLQAFFKDVIGHLPDPDKLYIIGPGEAKKLFRSEVEKVAELRDKIVAMENADSMTPNQLRARVHDFFEAQQASN